MSIDVSGKVGLDVVLGRLTRIMENQELRMRRLEDRIPRAVDIEGAAIAPASGASFLIVPQPGGPPSGKLWHVRRWSPSVFPTSTATQAGTIFAYIGMQPALPAQGDLPGNWRDKTSTALPVPAFYSDYEMVVHYPAKIYFIVTSPTASASYAINISVKEEVEGAVAPGSYEL